LQNFSTGIGNLSNKKAASFEAAFITEALLG